MANEIAHIIFNEVCNQYLEYEQVIVGSGILVVDKNKFKITQDNLRNFTSTIINKIEQENKIGSIHTLFTKDNVYCFASILAQNIKAIRGEIEKEQVTANNKLKQLQSRIRKREFIARYIVPCILLISSLYFGLPIITSIIIVCSQYLRNLAANIIDRFDVLYNFFSKNTPRFAFVLGLKSYEKNLAVATFSAENIINQISKEQLKKLIYNIVVENEFNFKEAFSKTVEELSVRNIECFYHLVKDVNEDNSLCTYFDTKQCSDLSHKLANQYGITYDNDFSNIDRRYNFKGRAQWLIENRKDIIKMYVQTNIAVIKDVFSKSEIDNIQTAGKHDPVANRLFKYTDTKTHFVLREVCKSGQHVARLEESRKNQSQLQI